MRAGIAFGSNLGDRLTSLKSARAEIVALPEVSEPILASSIYETEPVDCAPDAPRFFNAVIELSYQGTADHLLGELRRIERAHGRPPEHVQNDSRTLDLDLLYFGDSEFTRPDLQLPHARMAARRFVLEPLAEIRPDFILPGQSEAVAELLRSLPPSPPLRRVVREW